MRIYLSRRPARIGGGSNTFAGLFARAIKERGHSLVRSPETADLALVIAHLGDEDELAAAARRGCRIVHRLDEYFEENETGPRKDKHDRLIRLNAHAHVTVFQSRFVYENVYPHIRPALWDIIRNGGDARRFKPAARPGKYIGHVSWGVDTKKRLDLLREFILAHPEERFLLVGRHAEADVDLRLPNVKLAGRVGRWRMHRMYRKMKLLYFPSEKDPCPNTVVEAILCGVPVCYNPWGGSIELVAPGPTERAERACGLPLDRAEELLRDLPRYRANCLDRPDLDFETVCDRYLAHAR